jgi:hypothetical protein
MVRILFLNVTELQLEIRMGRPFRKILMLTKLIYSNFEAVWVMTADSNFFPGFQDLWMRTTTQAPCIFNRI